MVEHVEKWFQHRDPRETYDYGYYRQPPLDLNNYTYLLLKEPEIPAGTKGDIRNEEFAFYDPIIHNTGQKLYGSVSKRDDSLIIDQVKPDGTDKHISYSLIIDSDSYHLINEDKRHGTFFIATDPKDPSLRYDLVWANNQHIDHNNFVLEMAQYRNDIFQKLVIFGDAHTDDNNDKNYVPYVRPVAGMCPDCQGKGYEVSPGTCKSCHGSGYKNSSTYDVYDHLVKSEQHSDGSRTDTYKLAGRTITSYECLKCKGTGRELIPCARCKGTGQVMVSK